jgi:hypothetical protein
VDEQLEGRTPQSQFERSLAEIGVKVIHAHSPQAKGRVERLFATFQDRLVKERRLARIATLEDATRFLEAICQATTRSRPIIRATHVLVEERVDGTLRITHQGGCSTMRPSSHVRCARRIPVGPSPSAPGQADSRSSVAQTAPA